MLHEILHSLVDFVLDLVLDWGYWGIGIMMFLESSFVPFPSEVAIIPAGYHAAKGNMDLTLVIFSGTLGSLLGALFNYYLALTLGRKFIVRWGKYIFLHEQNLQKMEDFFKSHGAISTFTGRLIIGIRQYISLPAGLARMNVAVFSFYTSLGAGIWVVILAILGYFLGQNEELLKQYLQIIVYAVFGLLVLLVWWYIRRHRRKNEHF